jgi:ankyrin repeat protein
MNRIRTFILTIIIITFLLPVASTTVAASAGSFADFCNAYDKKDYESIVQLFESGLYANAQAFGDKTMLTHVAANAQDEEFAVKVAQLLLSKGARVNDEDFFGRAAVIYAIEQDRRALLELLLDNGADVMLPCRAYRMPAIFVPFMQDNPEVAYLVISKCPDVKVMDNLANTTLSWASRFGYLDSVRYLINKGAMIDNLSIHFKTPLMEASEKGHYDIAILLIQKGANVNQQTKKGWSALMWAAEKGYNEIVLLLIEAGADLFAKNDHGERALMIAQKNNHPETVKVIKKSEFRYWLKWILIVGGTVVIIIMIAVIIAYIRRRR